MTRETSLLFHEYFNLQRRINAHNMGWKPLDASTYAQLIQQSEAAQEYCILALQTEMPEDALALQLFFSTIGLFSKKIFRAWALSSHAWLSPEDEQWATHRLNIHLLDCWTYLDSPPSSPIRPI